jgi:hypothetical protein
MGRFRADAVLVRDLKEVTVIFWDCRSIYVYDKKTGYGIVFNRWFDEWGSYTAYWKDFRRKMLRWKNLSLLKCCELAARYDIVVNRTHRKLDLSKVKTRIIHE